MPRRNIVNYSDDDAEGTSPPPSPVKKKTLKHVQPTIESEADQTEIEDEEEATTSMDDFIDDRALDELSERSASAEEGFSDHEPDQRHKTPPLKHIEAPKFPLDTDDEDVEEAEGFQADVVESPKKRAVKTEDISRGGDGEEDESAMDISPIQKKMSKKRVPETEMLLVDDSGSDDIAIVGHKKAPAKKPSAPTKQKTGAAAKSTPTKKKTPRKKPISPEIISDTDDDAVVALKLSKDDEMYPESKSVKVQASNLKRGLPTTPPLATRSSSKKQKKEPVDEDADEKTPVKTKPRKIIEENDDEKLPAKASAKKAAARKTATRDINEEVDEDEALVKASTKKAATRKTAAHIVDEEDEEDEAPVNASTKKAAARKAATRHAEEEDEEDEASVKASAKKAVAPKAATRHAKEEDEAPVKASTKKAAARKAAIRHAEDEDEEDSDDEALLKSSAKNLTGRKTATRDIDEEDNDDEAPVKASTKKAVIRKTTAHIVDEEDEQDEAPMKASPKKAAPRNIATRRGQEKNDEAEAPVKASAKKAATRKSAALNVDEGEEGDDVVAKVAMKKAATLKTANRHGKVEPADEDDVFGRPAAKGASEESLPDLHTDTAFAAALAKVPKKPLKAPSEKVFDVRPDYGSVTQRYSSKIWKALAPPSSCEVYDANLCDPYLSSVKSYVGIPKLRLCVFENTGTRFSGIETGCIFLGMWKEVLPAATFKATVDAIAFTSDGQYVNLARIAPSRLNARAMSETRHETVIDDKTAIAVAVVSVRESGLVNDLVPTYPYKGVRGVHVTHEGQRVPSTLGELARRSVLYTQIWNSAITFNTKNQPSSRSAKATEPPSGFYNPYQSPKKPRSVNASSLPDHVGALEYNERIPVYDARNVDPGFKFNASVFANPADYFSLFNFDEFPEYEGEIPPNSLCIVGYVTQFYRMPDSAGGKAANGKGKGKATEEVEPQQLRVNMFIRWIFVLGAIN